MSPISRGVLSALLLVALLSPCAPGQQPKPSKPSLEQLLKLAPAERMRLLAKVVDKDKDFTKPTRGTITETLTERGSLEAVESTEVICRVRPAGRRPSPDAEVIRWLVEEGTLVKKGDKIITLDDADHVKSLQKQKGLTAKADAQRKAAADALERVKKENNIDIKIAQLDMRLADLALRQYKGNDPLHKETLAVQVERAALVAEQIKLKAAPKEAAANEFLNAKKSVVERERSRQREIEQDIANCVMTAPRDGLVIYFFPEGRSSFPGSITAQGEPVREGQKLLSIVDLKKMALTTLIDEAQIYKVRAGQPVKVRVDAFPGRDFTGKVTDVAKTPTNTNSRARGVKVYPIKITLDGDNKTLKPGMSAEAAITVRDKASCLRVPLSAVIARGNDAVCYVRVGKELQVRKITVGVISQLVEISNGLTETDAVLLDPRAAMERLNALRSEKK